jgi:hypothetical protein
MLIPLRYLISGSSSSFVEMNTIDMANDSTYQGYFIELTNSKAVITTLTLLNIVTSGGDFFRFIGSEVEFLTSKFQGVTLSSNSSLFKVLNSSKLKFVTFTLSTGIIPNGYVVESIQSKLDFEAAVFNDCQ